jgi:hypothetical protein
MRVDIKAIDDRIRKLQMLKELASDPEMATLLSEMVGSNGNSSKSKTPAMATANGDGRVAYAERAVRGMEGTFTTNDVTAKMKELGYVFTAKDASVATYAAMMLLKGKNIIAVREKGGPGKLAKWELV